MTTLSAAPSYPTHSPQLVKAVMDRVESLESVLEQEFDALKAQDLLLMGLSLYMLQRLRAILDSSLLIPR